jgi:hypothetical protein
VTIRRVAFRMCILVGSLSATTAVHAQKTTITVSGYVVSIAPTGADFQNTFSTPAPTSFTVDATTGPPILQRTTTVSIRCAVPCPASGTKALSHLKWSRADLGVWNTLTTTNVPVETRVVVRNSTNDPWSNQILWRFDLDWTTDPGAGPLGVVTTFNIIYTLNVTVP